MLRAEAFDHCFSSFGVDQTLMVGLVTRHFLQLHNLSEAAHIVHLVFGAAAITVAEIPQRHQILLDATLMGMGKGPGNLCTEEIAAYLDSNFYKSYDVELVNDTLTKEILP